MQKDNGQFQDSCRGDPSCGRAGQILPANNQFYTEKTKTEDGYDYYTATVPLSPSGEVYYVVSKAGFRKTAHTFTPAGQTIAVDALQEDYQLHEDTYEANIITNGNAAKFVSLQQGRGV